VSLARDFIAQFTPYAIHGMPEACRPGKFFDAGDITSFAFLLMRTSCDCQERISVDVHRLVEFFSAASIRLAQIMATDNSIASGVRRSA
jgi:hypothetical protein